MRSETAGTDKYLFSVEEAASLLGIGRSSLYVLFEKGKVLPLKIGKRTFVAPDALKRFVVLLEREATEHDLNRNRD